MKLSTKTRYAVRALLDLKNNFKNSPISIKEIAARENISERYLENIFHELKKASILDSTKGKGGGFKINTPLSKLTLLQLIEILEGDLHIVDCTGDHKVCDNKDCKSRALWNLINEKMKDTLSEIKLSDIESI